MKTHDVQSISIAKPADKVFSYVADPKNLSEWTNAFERANNETADLATPNGTVPIKLKTKSDAKQGTVDWEMIFPDGSVGTAFSRITPEGKYGCIYSFVLMAPPVPLEMLERALTEQSAALTGELAELKSRLET